jgi:DNA-damage-inducible protein J
MKTEVIRTRIDHDLKEKVEILLGNLGLSTSEAIRIFFKQIELRKGLPFSVRLPKEETKITFESTDKGKDLVYCKDIDDMFERTGSHSDLFK